MMMRQTTGKLENLTLEQLKHQLHSKNNRLALLKNKKEAEENSLINQFCCWGSNKNRVILETEINQLEYEVIYLNKEINKKTTVVDSVEDALLSAKRITTNLFNFLDLRSNEQVSKARKEEIFNKQEVSRQFADKMREKYNIPKRK